MTSPPRLFDPLKRRMRRDRAAAMGFERFLHAAAADGVAARLSDVARPFPHAVVWGAADGVYAERLRGRFGIENLRQCEEAPALAAMAARVAPCDIAPFEQPADAPGQADLLVLGFGLHAVDDPIAVLVQARRALKPDGLLLAASPGGRSLTELRDALLTAESELSGGAGARIAPMIDIRDAGGLLQRAGFAMPVVDLDPLQIWSDHVVAQMRDLRAMAETHMAHAGARPLRRDVLARAEELLRARHARSDGKIPWTVELIYWAGWAPSPTQPQPLRPGSATARLADALGDAETRTPRDADAATDGRET